MSLVNGLVSESVSQPQYAPVANGVSQKSAGTPTDSSTLVPASVIASTNTTYKNSDGDTVSVPAGIVLVGAHGDGHKGLLDPDYKRQAAKLETANSKESASTTAPTGNGDNEPTPKLTGVSLLLAKTYSQATPTESAAS